MFLVNKEKQDCLDKMSAELTKVGIAPEAKCDYLEEYHYLIDYVPKKFSYNVIYGENEGNQPIKTLTPEQAGAMRCYNKHVMEYIDHCVNKIKLESLKRNMQDNKSYELTTNQLALLGF